MNQMHQQSQNEQRSNARVGLICAGFAAGMLGLAFAAVPLYQIFCQVTGFAGTTQRVEQVADRVLDRTIKVRFDANIASSLGWEFAPKQREVELKLGEAVTVEYLANNIGLDLTTGSATFNVSPDNAGAYFNKLECFCFTETALKAGESLNMPVYFFVDPDLDDNPDLDKVRSITLSYTFYPVVDDGDKVASVEPVNSPETSTGVLKKGESL